MSNYKYKIETEIISKIKNLQKPNILELGVKTGISTNLFLNLCKSNHGKLFSVDIDDCSKVSSNKNWTFIKSRDDNFSKIFKLIPRKIDVIYIDTIHEADHVENILYKYFKRLKIGGYIFIDDISHLPYQKNKPRNNFYCEINNQETFYRLLEIFNANPKNIDLSFSFISSGTAIIKKKKNIINLKEKILSRKYSLKNNLKKIRNLVSF